MTIWSRAVSDLEQGSVGTHAKDYRLLQKSSQLCLVESDLDSMLTLEPTTKLAPSSLKTCPDL